MDVEPKPATPSKPKYAAALRYRSEVDRAPVVVASGRDEVAATILRLAEAAGVPNQVEPALAEILAKLEPGSEIPEETYQLVATIFAFIWRMDQRYQG
ncbi:MAG: EscU/YscU/HrcU family type III secretion system export apparatus switch protein [Bacillota bacterium]|jgi:flagellar biosynthesis protein